MNDRTKNKLSRIAKVIDTIMKINFVILIISLSTFLLGLLIPSVRASYYESLTTELDFGELSLRFPMHNNTPELNTGNTILPEESVLNVKFCYEIITGFIEFATIIFVICLIRKMMQPLIKGRPFSYELAGTFKWLAVISFVSSAVLTLAHNLFYLYFYHAYEIPENLTVFHETTYERGQSILAMLLPRFEGASFEATLILALFLWIVSILIEHGADLQVQYETTL